MPVGSDQPHDPRGNYFALKIKNFSSSGFGYLHLSEQDLTEAPYFGILWIPWAFGFVVAVPVPGGMICWRYYKPKQTLALAIWSRDSIEWSAKNLAHNSNIKLNIRKHTTALHCSKALLLPYLCWYAAWRLQQLVEHTGPASLFPGQVETTLLPRKSGEDYLSFLLYWSVLHCAFGKNAN